MTPDAGASGESTMLSDIIAALEDAKRYAALDGLGIEDLNVKLSAPEQAAPLFGRDAGRVVKYNLLA